MSISYADPLREMQTDTLDERVTLLEFQVENLNVEVTDQGEEIDVIDGEIAALLTAQVTQDERILDLESTDEGKRHWMYVFG